MDIRSDGKELSFICDEASALALEREATDLKRYEGEIPLYEYYSSYLL